MSNAKSSKYSKLTQMPNIGEKLAEMLEAVSIDTPQKLVELGSLEAIFRLKLEGIACYNKLYALEGAIRDMRWHDLSKEDKKGLKEAFDSMYKSSIK